MDVFLFTASAVAFRTYLRRTAARSSTTDAGTRLSLALLQQQDAETSTAIIDRYCGYCGGGGGGSGSGGDSHSAAAFLRLSASEGELTVRRDLEDDDKLRKGIDFARVKGVIDPDFRPEPYSTIDVLGRTPEQVADLILRQVEETKASQKDAAAGADEGLVLVIVGLSGTGKGTTVTRLRQILAAPDGGGGGGRTVVTWSNGNIFRSFTLLAATWCEQNCPGGMFNSTKALTTENLTTFSRMLSFHKRKDGIYDTRIVGLGLDLLVSEVQNTELKSPKVSQNIPTVAEFTQGEVINFAAGAVQTLRQAGHCVLLEGREQTVDYVRSPHRFNLVLSDGTLIGKRRAAQRIMASALSDVDSGKGVASLGDEHAAVAKALDNTLQTMLQEMEDHRNSNH